MKKTLNVTEAVRNFADCVTPHYQNVTFVLLKKCAPFARLVPDNEKICLGRDLAGRPKPSYRRTRPERGAVISELHVRLPSRRPTDGHNSRCRRQASSSISSAFLRFALRFLFRLLLYRSYRLFHTFPFLVLEITEGISRAEDGPTRMNVRSRYTPTNSLRSSCLAASCLVQIL